MPCAVAAQIVNGVLDGTYPDVRAIAVHHNGALVLEEYFYDYDRDRPHQMRSLTKSVVSLLAGAAVDRGLLRADEPVIARLGYASIENPDPRKERITLVDLLSNQSGLACDDRDGASPGAEVNLYDTDDWPKAFVDLPSSPSRERSGATARSDSRLRGGASRSPRVDRSRSSRRMCSSTRSASRAPSGAGRTCSIAASGTSSHRSISGRATCSSSAC